MRLFFVIALTLSALLSATVASGTPTRFVQGLDSDIELANGSGLVVANIRGALIGSLVSGKVTITDLPDSAGTDIAVQGADSSVDVNDQTTVYTGDNLRFRVLRGKWRIRIQGTGIFASVVGTGTIGLTGTEGQFSLNGGPQTDWPTVWQTLKLNV